VSLDRRRFLQLSALGAVAAVVDSGCQVGDMRALDPSHLDLVAMLGPERVRRLGELYMQQTPTERSVESLETALSKARAFRLFGQSIQDMVKSDFVNDRTVLVDGWVLSVTEARQAALFTLPHDISTRAY